MVILLILIFMMPSCVRSQQPDATPAPAAPKPWEVRPDSMPVGYFDPPMHRPVSLSGTFAEPRPNHFHSGIDLRIGGEIGEKVYAPADGWVSRVKVSPWGGGKTLYITHPNGYRTVYMHLDEFCGAVANYVLSYQYTHRTFELDEELPEGKYPVRRGQLIAFAGNTGGSGGPHLHYELRYAYNDEPLNPLYKGLSYVDEVVPVIRGVRLYSGDGTVANVPLAGGKTPLQVRGRCYAGICASDVSEAGSSGRNGIERIQLYIDDTLFWTYQVTSFLYDETRAINAIIDYPEYKRSGMAFFLTRRLRGDPSHHSRPVSGDGFFTVEPGKSARLRYVVTDTKGNAKDMSFTVTGAAYQDEPDGEEPPTAASAVAVAHFKKARLQSADCVAEVEAGTVYDNDYLELSTSRDSRLLSPAYSLQLRYNNIPPAHAYTLRLAMPAAGSRLRDRMVIVQVDGNKVSAVTTRAEGDWLVAKPRSFGVFGIMSDTEAPKVRPVNFTDGKAMPKGLLKVKISDNLSGVATYNCYINDQWVLAEFDGKNALLTISTRGFVRQGDNTFRVVLRDAAGNESETVYSLKL